jgi:signal transduction histidine kinase
VAAGDHRQLLDRMAAQLPDPHAYLEAVGRILADSPQESFDLLELADGRVFERYTRVQTIERRTTGRVWSYRDVTERAHAVEQLREAKTQAEAASRAKSAFLATISHELRTPLNAIAGYAQILEMEIHGGLTEQQRHSLARIQVSQRHLLTLIDEVLLHAKLETGTMGLQMARVPAGDAMANAETLVAPQAWSKSLTLLVQPCDPELTVRADPERLHQILVNLLSNAVKFTERGGRIELSCAARPGSVGFTVRDTGIGIPADKLEAVFEPFVQVRSDLTRTAEGTGLGLAISRALALGMSGHVGVESEPGRGSVFTLTLPAG